MPLTPWSSWILWLPLHSAGVQQFVALRSSSFLLPPLLIVYTTVYYNIYGSQHDGFDGFDGFSYQDPLRGKTLRVNSRHMYSTICGDMTSICDQCLHSPHETPRISHMYTDCCSEPVIHLPLFTTIHPSPHSLHGVRSALIHRGLRSFYGVGFQRTCTHAVSLLRPTE